MCGVRWWRLGLLAVGAAAFGCGGTGSRAPVAGKVTVNGAPLENGAIYFDPLDPPAAGERRMVGGAVSKGTYQIAADRGPFPGKYKVVVNWLKPTGKKRPTADGPEMMDETEEGLPAKYNAKTELTAEITSGTNAKDFDLKP